MPAGRGGSRTSASAASAPPPSEIAATAPTPSGGSEVGCGSVGTPGPSHMIASGAERLKLLRTNLLPMTSFGQRAQKQQAAVESLKDVNNPEEFLDRVIAVDGG